MRVQLGIYGKDGKWIGTAIDEKVLELVDLEGYVREKLSSFLWLDRKATGFVVIVVDGDVTNSILYTLESSEDPVEESVRARVKLKELALAAKSGSMSDVHNAVESMTDGEVRWALKMVAYGSWEDFRQERTAEWLAHTNVTVKCSNCEGIHSPYKFCPSCGFRMNVGGRK